MLKFMRDYMNKWVLGIVVGVIALVFVFFGVFPEARQGGMTSDNIVANVGSERITVKELEDAVSRDLEAYGGATGGMADKLRNTIRAQTLNTLIQSKLFVLEAKRIGIAASDAETINEIQQMPAFQDPAKKSFSVDMYKRLLEANHLSPAQFETNVRNFLVQRKLASFLENRIRVTEDEVKREYEVANERRNLTFVRITKDNAYKQMKVDSAEVTKFLADPSKANLIQANYEQNKTKYDRDAEVCARHILKRPAPGAEAKDTDKAPKEFLALHPTAKNFADLAKKNSEDPGSKEGGGDLGCFAKGTMDKAFEETAFKLSAGQVSGPVKSSFGWHYIYVYKKNEPIKIPLEKVRPQIAEELLKRDRMDEIRKLNREQADMIVQNWGKKIPGYEVAETGMFNAIDGYIPKIGRADEILQAAFSNSAPIQKGPQIFEAQGSFIVAAIKEHKSADPAKYSAERDSQEKSIRARKMQAFMPAWMQYVQKNHSIKLNNKLLSSLQGAEGGM